MDTSIFTSLFDEASSATSPQLRAAEIAAMKDPRSDFPGWSAAAPDAVGRDRRHAAMPSPLSLIVALAAELEATEARARRAEGQLAAHGRHCICRAGEIAAEEAEEPTVSTAGEAEMDGCLATDRDIAAPNLDIICRAA
jgi:hypothetical protein